MAEQSKIEAGQFYGDDKRRIDVHDVCGGEVLYQAWPEGVERQSMFSRLFRMPVAQFIEAIRSEGLRLDGVEHNQFPEARA